MYRDAGSHHGEVPAHIRRVEGSGPLVSCMLADSVWGGPGLLFSPRVL